MRPRGGRRRKAAISRGRRPPTPARGGKRSASGGAAGRSRDEGTKRCRPAGSAVPARRGRVDRKPLRASRPAGGRQRSVSVCLPFAHSPRSPAAAASTDSERHRHRHPLRTRCRRPSPPSSPPPHTPTATPAWAGAARAGR